MIGNAPFWWPKELNYSQYLSEDLFLFILIFILEISIRLKTTNHLFIFDSTFRNEKFFSGRISHDMTIFSVVQ